MSAISFVCYIVTDISQSCVCINLLYSKIRKPHDVKVLII